MSITLCYLASPLLLGHAISEFIAFSFVSPVVSKAFANGDAAPSATAAKKNPRKCEGDDEIPIVIHGCSGFARGFCSKWVLDAHGHLR
jgi:hypothetical protein